VSATAYIFKSLTSVKAGGGFVQRGAGWVGVSSGKRKERGKKNKKTRLGRQWFRLLTPSTPVQLDGRVVRGLKE
jgi:hypothetical protein